MKVKLVLTKDSLLSDKVQIWISPQTDMTKDLEKANRLLSSMPQGIF